MLHPGIGGDDEEARQPRADEHQEAANQCSWAKALLAEEEEAEKSRFQKEGEHAFHRQRLPDHAAGQGEKRAQLVPN